jgi:hypothetical protein
LLKMRTYILNVYIFCYKQTLLETLKDCFYLLF